MKKTALISMAVSLGLATLAANAASPHRVSPYMDLGVSCSCDWTNHPGTCTVSWSDVAGAQTYGGSIELQAEWVVNGIDMSSKAKLDLDEDWACDSVTGTCSASGEFALPDYPDNAAVTFDGKVAGLNNGWDGVTRRNFAKGTGACNLPENNSSDDSNPFDDDGTVIIDLSQY
jgi:hypothetical protein